jgi:hypothetical protein
MNTSEKEGFEMDTRERDIRKAMELIEPYLKGEDEIQIAYDMLLAAINEDSPGTRRRKRSGMEIQTVEQWHEVTYDREAGHGNSPEDMPIYHLGVGYYRRPEPEFAGSLTCEKCGKKLHDHGWIDEGPEGHDVCPGDWVVTLRNGGGHLPLPIFALQKRHRHGASHPRRVS